MKSIKELLGYYGKCCVSEYVFEHNRVYPSGEEGKKLMEQDAFKLEDIKGQKKAIEYILSE